MSEELKQHVLKNGLTLGGLFIFTSTVTYLGGVELVTNPIVSIAVLLLTIIFPIYFTRKFRANQEGFISFREAFTSCTGILIAAGFLNMVFGVLLYNIIDPEFAIQLSDSIINQTVDQLESIGMDDSSIESTIQKLEEEGMDFSPLKMLQGFIYSIIFYTVFGLIVAAFTKNERPEFS